MDDLYYTLEQLFGPLIQVLVFFFTLFLAASCIFAAAFWAERKLMQTKSRIFEILPLPIFASGILYGGLRFSGLLCYSTDGWDPWGYWNYTNQNCGVWILFVCGCMLIGAGSAMYKEKISLKS